MGVQRYLVHPGLIQSRTDGDRHFVSARQLMKLYAVHPAACLICRDCHRLGGENFRDCRFRDGYAIDLIPKFDGDYSLNSKGQK